jgi:hypothetical protein
MKMYLFDYKSYGMFYLVMAKSPEEALKAVKKLLYRKENWIRLEDGSLYPEMEYGDWLKWKDATLDNLPVDYRLKEYKENQVFTGEWS